MTCSLEGDFSSLAWIAELCCTMSPSSPSSSGNNSGQSSEGSQRCKEALSRAPESFSLLWVAHDCRIYRMNCIPEKRRVCRKRGEFLCADYFVCMEKEINAPRLLFFNVHSVLSDTYRIFTFGRNNVKNTIIITTTSSSMQFGVVQ